MDLFEFLHWSEGIVVSGDEKLTKPDHRICRVLFERYRMDPRESVFIEDSLPNIEAARELGLTGIHFKGPGELQQVLRNLGVIAKN